MSINNSAALIDQPQHTHASYIWSSEAPYLCAFYLFQTFVFFSIYCIFVICVVSNPKFHSAGFALLTSLMSAEQLIILTARLGGNLPITLHYAGMINYTYTAGRYVCQVIVLCYFSACFNLIAISIQRYYAVAFYVKYQDIFTKRNTGILIFVLWLGAFLISLAYMPLLSGPIKLLYSVRYYGPVYDLSDDFTKVYNIVQSTAFNGSVTGILILFVCMFLRKLRKIRRTTRPSSPPIAQVGQVDDAELQAAQEDGNTPMTIGDNRKKNIEGRNSPHDPSNGYNKYLDSNQYIVVCSEHHCGEHENRFVGTENNLLDTKYLLYLGIRDRSLTYSYYESAAQTRSFENDGLETKLSSCFECHEHGHWESY